MKSNTEYIKVTTSRTTYTVDSSGLVGNVKRELVDSVKRVKSNDKQ
jgi:hypothetical protein